MFQSCLNNIFWSKMKKELEQVLSMRRSRFSVYSVRAAAASAHTQCTPKLLRRILSSRQSFGHFLGSAAACTEYTPKLLERALSMRRSRWDVH